MKNIAIMGTGTIANAMARAVTGMTGEAVLYAVASRTYDKAAAFAAKWNVSRAYGSYEELVCDDKVDLVYIATPHSEHYAGARLCLEHGRNCLVEKAFTANEGQAAELIALAREKKLLLAEAMWTRYLPSTGIIRDLIAQGVIGTPVHLESEFSVFCSQVERIRRPELCGGALLDLGIYPLTSAVLFMDGPWRSDPEAQSRIEISGICSRLDTGVDSIDEIEIRYPDNRTARLRASVIGPERNECVIHGTAGTLTFGPVNNPDFITLRTFDGAEPVSYRIPAQINGYEYEVRSCIAAMDAGRLECDELPHAEILRLMRIMDDLRGRWGVVYPYD